MGIRTHIPTIEGFFHATIHLKKQKKAFNGEQEFRLPPKELIGDEIFTKVDMIHNSWGKKKKVKQCESFANPTSYWKNKSIFF